MNIRILSLVGVLLLALGAASLAAGQTRSTGTTRGSTSTNPPPDIQSQLIILSGKVITQDGSPLAEPVSIERICSGRVSHAGRSDFKGYFTVSISRSPTNQPDPESTAEMSGSFSNSLGTMNTPFPQNPSTAARIAAMGCELRASLAGYRSSSVYIPQEEVTGGTGIVNVGTIVLERMGKSEGTTVSATSLSAPKDARKAYDKGHHAVESNNLTEAQQELEKAVRLYPQYATAWQDLGSVYVQQNQLEKARNAFTEARTADNAFVPAYVGLSSIAIRESKWAEAAELSARATQLDGVDFPVAFYYNSLSNFRLGNLAEAEKSARKAETLGAQRSFPMVSLLLGVMLANRQEYAAAAEQMRAYLKAAPTAPNADKVRQQLAEVEKLAASPVKAEADPPGK